MKSKAELFNLDESDEWLTLSLFEAGVTLIDCLHSTPTAFDNGYPYIAIPQIKENSIDFTAARRINHNDFIKWTEKVLPQKDDIILSRRCNPGVTAYVSSGTQFAIGQNLVLLRSNGKKIYPPFLRWLVRGKEWWDQIDKFLNVGAIFDSLRCGDIPNFVLTIPSLQEQQKISFILSMLETKIENLQNQNKILEQIAQSIFKSWFVDFDGVKEFDDSELGRIPKGWIVSTIGEKLEVILGGTPSRNNESYWENGIIPWINSSKVNEFRITSPSELITEEGLKKSATQLIPKRTTVLAITGATLGQVSLLEIDSCANQSVIAIKGNDEIPSEYIYYYIKSKIDNIISSQTGGAQQHINRQNVCDVNLLVPKKEVMEKYFQISKPYLDLIYDNCFQIQLLTQTRDILLPKLMSGEIRV